MKSVTDQCPDITHVYTIGRSYTGLKLYVMVISDNPSKHELGMELLRFILESGHHGVDPPSAAFSQGPQVRPAGTVWCEYTHTFSFSLLTKHHISRELVLRPGQVSFLI